MNKEICPYEYNISYYDDDDYNIHKEWGITFATSYILAIKNIQSMYGDTIDTVSIKELEACKVYTKEDFEYSSFLDK